MKVFFNDQWKFKAESGWTQVTLPHDAMLKSPRSALAAGGGACAYFDGGIYEYERTLFAPDEWKGKEVSLYFGGVYRHTSVYVNGELAFYWANGYTPFEVPLTPYLKYGEENAIRVAADNSKLPNSRWYTGGGIYRPVTLVVKNKTHIKTHGVRVSTKSLSPAVITLSAERTGGDVEFAVYDGEKLVASRKGEGELTLPNAKLWSAEHPNLYRLKATLLQDGEVRDEEEVKFGVRTLAWSTEGFFVNGENVLLRGGCVHHDNGILGACAYQEAEERKARLLKEVGFNAVRSSHNPCSDAFLEACDKIGLYVMDEFSDMWYMRKKKYDYALDFEEWHERDITSFVRRDYNHPSVVMYSIGNEVSEPFEERGIQTAHKLADLVRSLDKTRPVTAGINLIIIAGAANGHLTYSEEKLEAEASPKQQEQESVSSEQFNMIAAQVGTTMNQQANSDMVDEFTSPAFAALDIAGYNYASGRYPIEGEKHPDRIVVGSETFPQDIYRNWQAVKKYPYLIGDFMWTAVDYLGEVGIGGWSYDPQLGITFEKPYPWIIGDTGAIDLIGTVGAEAEYAAAVWELKTKPYLGVRPVNKDQTKLVKSVWRGTNAIASWAWQGCEGNRADVEVYSSAHHIALLLNGELLGEKELAEGKALFGAKYRAGTLKAVAYDRAGKLVGETQLSSAGESRVRITPEKNTYRTGEVLFFDVTLADEKGTVESNADRMLTADIKGGELLAFGSAEQKPTEPYYTSKTMTYYGRALLVVRATAPELTVCINDDASQESAQVTLQESKS